jgi:lipoyl(octanoyl) transferase
MMIAVLNLGRCDYATALRLQESLVELRQQGRVPNVLLFVEHPPVITLGRNAREANIVVPREWLAGRGVEVHEINRGGDVTFHGPGQLVAYPVFDLRSFSPRLGAVSYVRLLEEVLMRICAQYGVETQRICGLTGVWTLPAAPPRLNSREMGRDCDPSGEDRLADLCVRLLPEEGRTGAPSDTSPPLPTAGRCGPPSWPERKIAAIGVHIARGVTSHGFALNVTTELDFFRLIVPCGLTRPVTSIEFETGLQPSLQEVMTVASRCFGERFGSQMLWLESIYDLVSEDSAHPLPPEADPASSQSGEASSGEASPASSCQAREAPPPCDTPARAPENERRIASDDFHLA